MAEPFSGRLIFKGFAPTVAVFRVIIDPAAGRLVFTGFALRDASRPTRGLLTLVGQTPTVTGFRWDTIDPETSTWIRI